MASEFEKVFLGRDCELGELYDHTVTGVQIIQIAGMTKVGKTELARHYTRRVIESYHAMRKDLHYHEISLRGIEDIQNVISQLYIKLHHSMSINSEHPPINKPKSEKSQSDSFWQDQCSQSPCCIHMGRPTHCSTCVQSVISFQKLMDTISSLHGHYLILLDNAEDMSSVNSNAELQTQFLDLCVSMVMASDCIQLLITTTVKFKFMMTDSLFWTLDLKPLSEESAEQLLELTALPAKIDKQKLKNIADLCGRIPMDLLLAAATIRDGILTAEELCATLKTSLVSEETSAIISASMDRLSAVLKQHSSQLEYIPGSFGPGLAAAISGKTKTAFVKQDVLLPMQRRCILDSYMDSIIRTKRYDLHPFIREFIRDHFSHLRDEDLIRDRFCVFFAHLLNELSLRVDHHPANTLPLLSVEMQNIEKFLREAMHCSPERYHTMIQAAQHGEYLLINFLPTAGSIEFYAACLNSARLNGNNIDCAVMLHCYGQALNQIRGNWNDAYSCYTEAIELLKPLGDNDKLARLYSSMGWNLHMQGKERHSLHYFHRAYRMQTRLGLLPHKDTAATLSYLGTVHTFIGEFTKAKSYHTEAYDMKAAVFGDHPAIGGTQNSIGLYYNQLGDGDSAFRYFKLALETKRRFNKKPANDLVISLNNVAMEYSKRGYTERALRMLDEAFQMRKSLGLEHHDTSLIFNNRAKVYASVMEYDKSEECFRTALQIRRMRMGVHTSTAGTLQQLGEVLLKAGKLQQAREAFTEAVDMRKTVLIQQPQNEGIAESLGYLAETYQQLGDKEQAKELTERHIQELQRVVNVYRKWKQENKVIEVQNKIDKLRKKFET
ncbi:uncharacterized protein LOC144441285 [Glandiceps talaboti]